MLHQLATQLLQRRTGEGGDGEDGEEGTVILDDNCVVSRIWLDCSFRTFQECMLRRLVGNADHVIDCLYGDARREHGNSRWGLRTKLGTKMGMGDELGIIAWHGNGNDSGQIASGRKGGAKKESARLGPI